MSPGEVVHTKVLVVDDDPDVRTVVCRALEREGFEVLPAAGVAEALALVTATPAAVAVLDVNLQGESGFDLLDELRRRDPSLHAIMLTAASSEADRVRGLLSGADDYVIKPFSVRELAARVVAASRRRQVAPPDVVEVGDVRIDLPSRAVTVAGRGVRLTRREFDLLRHLAANAGLPFRREELLQSVWSSSADWQGVATVTEHVRRLRQKIEDDPRAPQRIVTVRPSSYRFEATVAVAPIVLEPSDATASIVIVDAKVVHASAAALELVGAGAEDVIGADVLDFVAPDSMQVIAARRQALTNGRQPRPEIVTIVRADGRPLMVEISTSFVAWAGQTALQVTMWDLSGGNPRLQELVTGVRAPSADAVVVADAKLRIQSFNRAAADLYGWTEEDVLGRSIVEVAPPTPDVPAGATSLDGLLAGGHWHGEVEHRRRDGEAVAVVTSATIVTNSVSEAVGLVCVTRRAASTTLASVDHLVASTISGGDVRRGLRNGEFTVHYQPIVALDDGVPVGMEALVRWHHPTQGLLLPGAFIDVAERSGAIAALGTFVLQTACRQAAAWRTEGRILHVSVNLSARQLVDPSLCDLVLRTLEDAGLPPEFLWLEVTETSLVRDLDQARAALRKLADVGIGISIDDFGTGWASLTYLREFPISSLKIDRVFVDGLASGAADAAIVSSIVSLGAELDLFVTAEGIETEEQRRHLQRLGCTIGQGYLFGRPVPAAEVVGTVRLPAAGVALGARGRSATPHR
jgi:PAS domain S-box-containing protein